MELTSGLVVLVAEEELDLHPPRRPRWPRRAAPAAPGLREAGLRFAWVP